MVAQFMITSSRRTLHIVSSFFLLLSFCCCCCCYFLSFLYSCSHSKSKREKWTHKNCHRKILLLIICSCLSFRLRFFFSFVFCFIRLYCVRMKSQLIVNKKSKTREKRSKEKTARIHNNDKITRSRIAVRSKWIAFCWSNSENIFYCSLYFLKFTN